MIKKNIKLFIGIIIGAVVFGSIGAYAANKIHASSVSVDTTNMSALGASSNVDAALTYLYGKASQINQNIYNGVGPTVWPGNVTNLGIIYLDPTDLTRTCTIDNSFVSIGATGKKSGCMKWYIYKEDSNNYYAILDHNTTAAVAWASSGGNKSQREVATALTDDTTGWDASLNPRLITADEIAHIVGADTKVNWNSSTSTSLMYLDSCSSTQIAKSRGKSNYAWLFDYTGSSSDECTSYGCDMSDITTLGYWTSTKSVANNNDVWGVNYRGRLQASAATNTWGVRPVITISKSIFS